MKPKDRNLMISLLNNAGAAIEAAFEIIAKYEEESGGCEHPEDKRKDYSTMGVKRWKCTICGYFYEQGKEAEE
jgi:hypothetical protein